MNALKHIETIFAVVVVAGIVVAALPDSTAKPAPRDAATAPAMPVVVIKGKRMTAQEKRPATAADATAQRGAAKGA